MGFETNGNGTRSSVWKCGSVEVRFPDMTHTGCGRSTEAAASRAPLRVKGFKGQGFQGLGFRVKLSLKPKT
jgi:hypothetical protein